MQSTSALSQWQNFYVIVGSSGGALTGLQFVVIALIDERQAGGMQEIRAFGTPTIVHFGAALLISAILSAPWRGLSTVSYVLVACGLGGVAYCVNVVRHTRRVSAYQPDRGDWFWYAVLPLVAYILLLVSAVGLRGNPVRALFVIAAVALVLLFNGIHNAWDSVTYIAVGRRQQQRRTAARK